MHVYSNVTDTGKAVNKSELEVMTRGRHVEREKTCEPVTIGFGFASGWMKKWREFLKPIVAFDGAFRSKRRTVQHGVILFPVLIYFQ